MITTRAPDGANKGSISTLVISKLNGQAYIENFLQFSNKTVVLSRVICKGFLSDNVLTAYLAGVGKVPSLPYQ